MIKKPIMPNLQLKQNNWLADKLSKIKICLDNR